MSAPTRTASTASIPAAAAASVPAAAAAAAGSKRKAPVPDSSSSSDDSSDDSDDSADDSSDDEEEKKTQSKPVKTKTKPEPVAAAKTKPEPAAKRPRNVAAHAAAAAAEEDAPAPKAKAAKAAKSAPEKMIAGYATRTTQDQPFVGIGEVFTMRTDGQDVKYKVKSVGYNFRGEAPKYIDLLPAPAKLPRFIGSSFKACNFTAVRLVGDEEDLEGPFDSFVQTSREHVFILRYNGEAGFAHSRDITYEDLRPDGIAIPAAITSRSKDANDEAKAEATAVRSKFRALIDVEHKKVFQAAFLTKNVMPNPDGDNTYGPQPMLPWAMYYTIAKANEGGGPTPAPKKPKATKAASADSAAAASSSRKQPQQAQQAQQASSMASLCPALIEIVQEYVDADAQMTKEMSAKRPGSIAKTMRVRFEGARLMRPYVDATFVSHRSSPAEREAIARLLVALHPDAQAIAALKIKEQEEQEDKDSREMAEEEMEA